MSLRVVKARGPGAAGAVRAAMARDGAVALDGLFPRPLLLRLQREVLRRHATGELLRRGRVRDIGGRYAAVLPLEGPFLDPRLWAAPGLEPLLAALLGPDHRLSSVETVIARPGAVAQHQHVDGPVRFDVRAGRGLERFAGDLSRLPPYAVTLAVPLVDFDEENGPTAVWLGSHRAALLPRPPGEAAVRRRYREARLAGRLGRAFLFDYRLFHGGTPNLSREPRPLLVLVFTRPWFRDPNLAEVRPGLALSPRALARVPARARALFALAPAARRALWEPERRRRS